MSREVHVGGYYQEAEPDLPTGTIGWSNGRRGWKEVTISPLYLIIEAARNRHVLDRPCMMPKLK